MGNKPGTLCLGIDIGSTTVKSVVWEPSLSKILSTDYLRHDGVPLETLIKHLKSLHSVYPDNVFRAAFTGSQCSEYAQWLKAPYIQEVIAGSIAVSHFYPETYTSIELGGQDAKILFFNPKENCSVHDMRMNGVCAGGTGAFLDQIATLLNIPVEDFNEFASHGTKLYDISGRCGVFAKTDIQPLLNQGVPREDIALSCLHALAKQTIGGLAQGMEIKKPVLFAGGPFHFMPKLIEVFCQRLELGANDYTFPQNAQTLIALGSALALNTALADRKGHLQNAEAMAYELESKLKKRSIKNSGGSPFFKDLVEKEKFTQNYKLPHFKPKTFMQGVKVSVYIGIDAGSTTTKFVVINENKEVLYKFYESNKGKPIDTAKKGLIKFYSYVKDQGASVEVKGLGSTGYGEHLFTKAFGTDFNTVETIAHKEAASFYEPKTSFILDLGGQDMKAIFINNGVITDIVLNEACSAGCGSFIESYSKSLDIKAQDIAEMAFQSDSPSSLGSRCTVFMNSSIITEQKNGKTVNDILAGLCRSVIENLFTKVIRIQNSDSLGNNIVVQGGTFKNDAVLKAFIEYTGKEVTRPSHAGEMGAIGIALLTIKNSNQWNKSQFIGFDEVKKLSYKITEGEECSYCANACARSIIRFNNGTTYVTGNRCERGEVVDIDIKDNSKASSKKDVPDMMQEREKLLLKDYNKEYPAKKEKGEIGIPLVLDFYDSLPFWGNLFASLGYKVIHSGKSSYKIFESGLQNIPSDTVCLPAKVVHGHFRKLAERGVKRIFFPAIQKNLKTNNSAEDSWNCAVLQGYPEVIKISEFSTSKFKNIELHSPAFKWTNLKLRKKQILKYLQTELNESQSEALKAFKVGEYAQRQYIDILKSKTAKIIQDVKRENSFAVLLAARPYHGDLFISHSVSSIFTSKGIAVLINEGFDLDSIDLNDCKIDTYNPFHTRMLAAANVAAKTKNIELVQLVSFGCGHDAVLTDEVSRILKSKSDKTLLSLKLDEGENKGPLNIRVTSFIETIKSKKGKTTGTQSQRLSDSDKKYYKNDRHREILIPNLSRSFSLLMNEAFAQQGYRTRILPFANRTAIEFGKKYVHNDICFPAQVNIGEHLNWLHNNKEKSDNVAVMLAKNCNDCRAGHYATLARKALDANGFKSIPILTTDFNDSLNNHPGFRMNETKFNLFSIRGMSLIDAIDDMQRKCRPYEKIKGSTNKLHEIWCTKVLNKLRTKGFKAATKLLESAINEFNQLETERLVRKPRVGIIGELLVNYHEAGNYKIIEYLEQNGMEVVLPSIIEFWRQEVINFKTMGNLGHSRIGKIKNLQGKVLDKIYQSIIDNVEKKMIDFKYYEPHSDIHKISSLANEIIDISYRTGEGWLIPGEIMNWLEEGINTHLIVQPFGCLPNHISGRGTIKAIKNRYPKATILSMDFDPDTSLANIHNRMQMIILNACRCSRFGDNEKENSLMTTA